MKILLFNPPRYNNTPVARIFRAEYLLNYCVAPPMDLAYFSAFIKKINDEVEIQILDANGENLNHEEALKRIIRFSPDVIITKGVLNILEHDLIVPKLYKTLNPNVKIFLNSRTAIGFEDFILKKFPFIDGILTGELDAYAHYFSKENLTDIKKLNKSLKNIKKPLILTFLDDNPLPDIDALPNIWYGGYYGHPYTKSGYFLVGGRGCVFKCSYCPTGGIINSPFFYRVKSIENVILEIKEIKERNIDDFFIFDEISTIPRRAELISKAIIKEKLDVTWGCEGMVKFVNRKMLYWMKKAGCRCIYYGIETADEKSLKMVNKPQTYQDMVRAIKLTKKMGIKVGLYLMLGLPSQSWYSFFKTLKLILSTNPDAFGVSILSPYPGTTLYKVMVYKSLINNSETTNLYDRHISKFTDSIPIKTEKLKPTEIKLQEIILKMFNYLKNRSHIKFFV
ncbi:MAG: B12-binding domain-containing radical SAM protein [Candidatus Aenigmatarchaeota archaeon]